MLLLPADKTVAMKEETEIIILVIENRAEPNPMIHQWVKSIGAQKIVKANGIEALMWLGRGNIPVMIIAEADMALIQGMQFVEYLKANGFFQDIPVIAFGGPESRERIAAMMQAGASDYLMKPFEKDQLAARLTRFLEEQPVV